jgi:hypothetical protein
MWFVLLVFGGMLSNIWLSFCTELATFATLARLDYCARACTQAAFWTDLLYVVSLVGTIIQGVAPRHPQDDAVVRQPLPVLQEGLLEHEVVPGVRTDHQGSPVHIYFVGVAINAPCKCSVTLLLALTPPAFNAEAVQKMFWASPHSSPQHCT